MDLFRNDDWLNSAQLVGWIRLLGHSAPRLSPGLRPPSLCRCAACPSSLILHAKVGIPGKQTTDARCRGRCSGWRSMDLGFCQIKGEPRGRRTFAEPPTAAPLAPASLGLGLGFAKAIHIKQSRRGRCREFRNSYMAGSSVNCRSLSKCLRRPLIGSMNAIDLASSCSGWA